MSFVTIMGVVISNCFIFLSLEDSMNNVSKKLVLSSVLFSALAVNSITFGGWWPETPAEKTAREKSQQEQKAAQEKAQAEQEKKAVIQKRVAGVTSAVAVALEYEKEIQQRFHGKPRDKAHSADIGIFGSEEVNSLRSITNFVPTPFREGKALDLAFVGAYQTCSKSGARQTVPCLQALQTLYGALSGNPVTNSSLDLAKEPAAVVLEETRRRVIAKLLDGKAVSQDACERLTKVLEKTHDLAKLECEEDFDSVPGSTKKELDQVILLEKQRKEKAEFWRSIIGTVDLAGAAGSAGDK